MIHDEVGSGEIVLRIESDLSSPERCAALAQSVTHALDVLINTWSLVVRVVEQKKQ